jgi:murein DD-endopeptidase MepM/ murein hydrolase activator NlpD
MPRETGLCKADRPPGTLGAVVTCKTWDGGMRDKITFLVFNHDGAPIRQWIFSKKLLAGSMAFFLIGVVTLGLLAKDYYRLKRMQVDFKMHAVEIGRKETTIAQQRRQLQELGDQINLLKTDVAELSAFEEKIRVIAHLDQKDGQEGFLGVGGQIPEDIDTNLSLQEQHIGLIREMHDQVRQVHDVALVQKQSFESLMVHLEAQRNLLAATPAVRPVDGWITSRFGNRQSPFTNLNEFHQGLDIANRVNSEVIATADGSVTFAGTRGHLGLAVTIDHGHGYVTRYAHLNKILTKRGDTVKRGEVIGLLGSTGRSTGPHLHYEVRLNNVPVNPEKYILN